MRGKNGKDFVENAIFRSSWDTNSDLNVFNIVLIRLLIIRTRFEFGAHFFYMWTICDYYYAKYEIVLIWTHQCLFCHCEFQQYLQPNHLFSTLLYVQCRISTRNLSIIYNFWDRILKDKLNLSGSTCFYHLLMTNNSSCSVVTGDALNLDPGERCSEGWSRISWMYPMELSDSLL